MTARVVLDLCARRGVRLEPNGNGFRAYGPPDARAELKPLVLAHKREILGILAWPAPDPTMALEHCLRVRPDTRVTNEERQALGFRCATLPTAKHVDALLCSLWDYWRSAPVPNLTEFLRKENHRVN